MDTSDHAGGVALESQRLRNLELLGYELTALERDRGHPDLSASGRATLSKKITELRRVLQILRGGRVWR